MDDFQFFPNSIEEINTYQDNNKTNPCKVISLIQEDESINFKYKAGARLGAFAGFHFDIKDKSRRDFTSFNQISVEYSTTNIQSFIFQLNTFEDGISDTLIPKSIRKSFFSIESKTGQVKKSETMNLDDFKTYLWWKKGWGVSKEVNENPNWQKVTGISVVHERVPDNSIPSEINLYSITLQKSNRTYFQYCGLILLMYFTGVLIYSFNKKYKVVIQYRSVEVSEPKPDNWQEEVLNYIGKEYINAELSLNEVSRHVAKNQKVVAKSILDKFHLTFKQYLNNIRIEESKKLLLNTDLSIKEIAYSVGYSSANHFTKVFKKQEDMTPSQFKSETDS